MSGNFLSCSKDPFEFPEFRCDEPPDASEEMGLISPGAENLLDFLELGRVSRVTTGTSGTRSGGLRKGQCPWELQGGLSGFLSRRCRGLRPCVESMPETEDSSPVLTWILGYFWSLPWESVLVSCGGMPVRLPSKLYQQCHASLHVDQGIRGFPSRISHEVFPRVFPTGLSHVPPWCESILGLKFEAVQGKQDSL